jgi:hypothetical protein
LVTVLRILIDVLPQVSLAAGASKSQALAHSTVLAGTHTIVGGVLSTVVTVWLQLAVLPQASVACQVRVAVKVPPQCPAVLVTLPTMLIVTLPQVSLAVGASKLQAVAHSAVLSAAQAIVGGVVSFTVTVWLQVLLLPQVSLALQVRVAV